MALGDQESEYGEGRGRTGYVRALRADEEMRLMRATDPADPGASVDKALAAELLLEGRSRTDEPLRRGGQAE